MWKKQNEERKKRYGFDIGTNVELTFHKAIKRRKEMWKKQNEEKAKSEHLLGILNAVTGQLRI